MPRKFLRSLRRRRRSRRRSSKKKTTNRQKSKKMRGGVTVRAQDLKTRLPEDMFGEIREMHPLLTPKLTNATIRRAVRDYLNGGARKQRVVTKYGDISNWDVSNVTDMNDMFLGETSFNQPLNKWNVSNVTDMWCMFWGAESFNQPLNNWNVSNVRDMEHMFTDTPFNQPLHAPWYYEDPESPISSESE